ncbi:MAG TPA: nitrate- and nitrite sensing domain-containing protein, partial [Streptosporangiaceae bacterium]|nr:nitrate- and nitrite sensing domain-containing protein [Streptosporangiaceae bacterium]
MAATGPQAALPQTASGPSGAQQSGAQAAGPQGPPAVQAPGAAPPASMVQSTHPHPRRPTSSRSRFALVNWRVRWRLAAIIAVPTLTAAVLGALTINSDVNNWEATGRVQHLTQLNNDVVNFSQKLEDELNVSAAYAATRPDSTGLQTSLKQAQNATDAAARTVTADSAAVTTAAGYQPGTVQDLNAVEAAINDLPKVRTGVTGSKFPASQIVRVYSGNLISPANTFSGAIGNGANDADLQGNVTTLGALLRNENQVAVQRAILYGALVSPAGTLRAEDLTNLQQAHEQAIADLADFNASTDTGEQQTYSNTVSGARVDVAAGNEILAEQLAGSQPTKSLRSSLDANQWNQDMSLTITDTRSVANDLAARIASRANALRSDATTDLLVTGLVTLLLLALVVMVSTIVARSLIRPLRKLRTDALDVAGHRLPEMVRRLSQSEGADEGVEIEPIGVTSTDEIGEVARAFDQVHREADRLAADEAMLRGNLNAMFVNLSRRSQSLIERQLSLIDNLEQSEQDADRLSSLFRLDHLATRMRRNSENLLVLAGHEAASRRWSQPVPLVDVLRAAISEIEQYERVVLNVQPGIQVVGQAVNDIVHLVAEIVENATTFSPEDTQVYVTGQPLTSGGVLLDITDNGVGIADQEMAHANWRLDNPPVVDVAVSRRMGLFVVGRLAARHGVRVRLRHAQSGGLTALIWLPESVATPDGGNQTIGRLRKFEADDYGPAPSLSAPTTAPAPPAPAGPVTLPGAPAPAVGGTGFSGAAATASRIPRLGGAQGGNGGFGAFGNAGNGGGNGTGTRPAPVVPSAPGAPGAPAPNGAGSNGNGANGGGSTGSAAGGPGPSQVIDAPGGPLPVRTPGNHPLGPATPAGGGSAFGADAFGDAFGGDTVGEGDFTTTRMPALGGDGGSAGTGTVPAAVPNGSGASGSDGSQVTI